MGNKFRTFCSSKVSVGKIAWGRGLGAEPSAAGSQLGSGGGTFRAWRIFTNFLKKNNEFLSAF